MPLLSSSILRNPLSPHLSVGHDSPGHFRDHAQCRSCGLSSASVTSVSVVPKWHHSLRLCCASPMARAISDMVAGPNPDSNPGLSDLRQLANDIELGPIRAAGSNPGCANREVEKKFRRTRARIEPRSRQSKIFNYSKIRKRTCGGSNRTPAG